MIQPSEKQSPMIRKAHSLIYLIEECSKSGDDETVSSLCKSMMLCLCSTPKDVRMRLFRRSLLDSACRLNLLEEDNSSSPTA